MIDTPSRKDDFIRARAACEIRRTLALCRRRCQFAAPQITLTAVTLARIPSTVRAARDDGFLNVDLEVGARARAQLTPLLDALQNTLFELYRGRIRSRYCAFYEISGCGPSTASATICALAAVIEGLAAPARRAWDGAVLRDFNIGVELAPGVRSIELAIDRDVISRVSALGGRIAFTAYQVTAMSQPRRKQSRKRASV